MRIIESCRPGSASVNKPTDAEVQALYNPLAPIDGDTAKELELVAIQNNVTVRVDLCYDDDLFFRPIEGRKGAEKRCKIEIHRECLSWELSIYAHNLRGNCSECAQGKDNGMETVVHLPSRLAKSFSALRDLIGTLLPDRDKAVVLERLDVDHLVRLSRAGTFDAVTFADWLTRLLKTHCAPCRDEMVEKMNRQISDGARTNNVDLLVKGLQTLLLLLEAMKLDVANHQLRYFKSTFIKATVPFLQNVLTKMQTDSSLDLESAKRWFLALKRQRREEDPPMTDFELFVLGTVRLCRSPCASQTVPGIFMYERGRLACLRNEVLDMTHLRICVDALNVLIMRRRGREATVAQTAAFRDRVVKLISAEDGTSEGMSCHLDDVATEIVRVSADTSVTARPHEPSREGEAVEFSDALEFLETRLSTEKPQTMKVVLDDLAILALQHAGEFQKMDTLQLSEAQRWWRKTKSSEQRLCGAEMEDVARRLAHIITMQWRVWAPLVYSDEAFGRQRQESDRGEGCRDPLIVKPAIGSDSCLQLLTPNSSDPHCNDVVQ